MSNYEFENILWGEKIRDGQLTLQQAEKYFSSSVLLSKSKDFRTVPIDKIIEILEKTGEKITDKDSIYYKECMRLLPHTINYSPQMIRDGLKMFREMLKRENLVGRLKVFGSHYVLDHFVHGSKKRIDRVMPVGSICHIAAGNIFLGAVDSLVYGVLTKNINVLKASSKDFIFPTLFMDALLEVDSEEVLIPNISVVYWDRKEKEIEAHIKKNFDGILLFGGEESVINYKEGLSAKTDLYSFGPKLSFGLVSKGLTKDELKKAAYGFADDIILWEQRACTSCQNIFIEKDATNDDFIGLLYDALEEKALKYPQPKIDIDSAVEICRERELARWREFNGEGLLIEGKNSNHTIIVGESNNVLDSPLNRTVYINKIDSYTDILRGNIDMLGFYMSTVGIASRTDTQRIVEDFMKLGVMRFCKPGCMAMSSKVNAPHDGVHIAKLLVKEINTEDLDIDAFGMEYLDRGENEDILLSKLNSLLMTATKAPFYKAFYGDLKLPLKSLEDFKKVPILEKSHLVSNDNNSSMLTGDKDNCYVFSAGGTTGEKKHIWYTNEELEKSQTVFGRGFRSLGIDKKDFVVNYLKAGALWTAFLATNKGLEETGCKILSLSSNQTEDETIEFLKEFKPNKLLSIPGNIILLAQRIKEMNLDINIDKIYYGGDHIASSSKDYLFDVFKCKEIRSMGYAAVETGPIGFQCEHCKNTEHHIFEDWCYLERDENGDALVTVLGRELHPIIRYRLGDVVELVNEKCACGRTSPRIRLLSRSDDKIKFNFSDLHLGEIDSVLEEFHELSSFSQVIVENEECGLKFILRVESQNILSYEECRGLSDRIKTEIENSCFTLGRDSRLNLIRELKVDILPTNGIERMTRTGKMRRIIDKRMQAS